MMKEFQDQNINHQVHGTETEELKLKEKFDEVKRIKRRDLQQVKIDVKGRENQLKELDLICINKKKDLEK
jgi:hypothetical protein